MSSSSGFVCVVLCFIFVMCFFIFFWHVPVYVLRHTTYISSQVGYFIFQSNLPIWFSFTWVVPFCFALRGFSAYCMWLLWLQQCMCARLCFQLCLRCCHWVLGQPLFLSNPVLVQWVLFFRMVRFWSIRRCSVTMHYYYYYIFYTGWHIFIASGW